MRFTRSCWVLAAAGLLLAACRTDGERGEAAPQERGAPAPGGRFSQAERAATGANVEEAGTARILAAARGMLQGEVDAGKLAQQRASSPEVKDYATRVVAEYQTNLDALSDLAKAKKIDVDGAAIQGDPLIRAQRDTAKEGLERMRSLSGTPFDGTYMTAQRSSQALLAQLAQGGSRDLEVANVLRTVGQQARERANKALGILPKACGGERPGWGGAG